MSIKIQETQQIALTTQLKSDKTQQVQQQVQEHDDISLSSKAKYVQKVGVIPSHQVTEPLPPTKEQLSSLEKHSAQNQTLQQFTLQANAQALPLVKNKTPNPAPAATPEQTIKKMEELKKDQLSHPDLSINEYMALMRAQRIADSAKASLQIKDRINHAHEPIPKANKEDEKA
jgi:hypothetical protein